MYQYCVFRMHVYTSMSQVKQFTEYAFELSVYAIINVHVHVYSL